MRRFVLVLLVFVATPLLGINTGPVSGDRIAVLSSWDHRTSVAEFVPRYLTVALERAGYDAYRLRETLDEYRERSRSDRRDHFVIEIDSLDRDVEAWSAVGLGRRHVGAEVSVVSARIAVTVRLYEAESMALVDEFTVERNATTPTVSAVGLGDRHSFLFVDLPFMNRIPYRIAAKDVARDIVNRLSGPRVVAAR